MSCDPNSLCLDDTPPSALTVRNVSQGQSNFSTKDAFPVVLNRGNRGFGFSIRGGQEFDQMLFVLKIAEGGAAHVDGRLKVSNQ